MCQLNLTFSVLTHRIQSSSFFEFGSPGSKTRRKPAPGCRRDGYRRACLPHLRRLPQAGSKKAGRRAHCPSGQKRGREGVCAQGACPGRIAGAKARIAAGNRAPKPALRRKPKQGAPNGACAARHDIGIAANAMQFGDRKMPQNWEFFL